MDNQDIMKEGIIASLQEWNDEKPHFINSNLIKNKMTILKSRTFWTIVVMFLYNGVMAIHNLIPVSFAPLVDGLLSIVAVYFHMNPSQNYSTSSTPTV